MRHGTLTGRKDGFDMVKLEEAVHYICSHVTASDRLGAVKLNKILFYSDMLHFAEHEHSITGATYAKRQRGPVPKQILPAIENLKRDGRLDYRMVSLYDLSRREFDAFGQTKLEVFQNDEIERLEQMIRFVCDQSAEAISEFSHTIVWEAADIGEELPYETFLVSYIGEPDDTVIQDAANLVAAEESANGITYA